jgi:uncharacterized protein YdeI (YjbR/CyaY-like superfamily)
MAFLPQRPHVEFALTVSKTNDNSNIVLLISYMNRFILGFLIKILSLDIFIESQKFRHNSEKSAKIMILSNLVNWLA